MTPYNVVSVEALSDSMVRVSGAARCFAAVGVRAARITDGASSQHPEPATKGASSQLSLHHTRSAPPWECEKPPIREVSASGVSRPTRNRSGLCPFSRTCWA